MSLTSAVKVSRRIAEIGREGWDACAGNPDYAANPFVSFDFLDIVEESGCAAVPGSAFGAPGYLRFSYATSEENIDKGLAAAKAAVEAARSRG